MKKTFSNVVIIGAGFSGLSAAATLVQNGFQNVIILEARNRIGGRFSVETHNGHVLHMGAQWVHGVSSSSNNSDNTTDDVNSETNSMFVLAKKYGLLDENMPRDGFGDMNHESFELEHVYLKGGENIPEKYTEMAGQIYSKICSDWGNFSQFDDDQDLSIEEAFKVLAEKELETLKTDLNPKEFNYVETVLFGCFKNILVGYAGDTITNCSAKIFGVSDELPGGDLILPTSILDKMYLEKILRLNHKVSKINWKNDNDDKKIVIEVENCKEVFETDFVICTFPPGVMKKYHEHIFNPRLPEEKIQAYNQICPGAICKYFVEWNKPWRKESNKTPIMIAWDRKDLENINLPQDWIKGCFEIVNIDPFGTLMMLWIVGDCAKAADTLEDEDIKNGVGRLLTLFQGSQVPPPDNLYRNCWTQDDYSLGTYSAASLTSNENTFFVTGQPLPSENDPRLLFAGEATDPKYWSFLHGARDSGIREAMRIISKSKSKN